MLYITLYDFERGISMKKRFTMLLLMFAMIFSTVMPGFAQSEEISVRDDKAKLFLEILKEFKSDMVEKFTILNNDSEKYQHDTNEEFNQSKKYFHRCLDDIENNNTTLLSQDEYKDSMKMFTDKLKKNYANN